MALYIRSEKAEIINGGNVRIDFNDTTDLKQLDSNIYVSCGPGGTTFIEKTSADPGHNNAKLLNLSENGTVLFLKFLCNALGKDAVLKLAGLTPAETPTAPSKTFRSIL